jgi:hypothetical protein
VIWTLLVVLPAIAVTVGLDRMPAARNGWRYLRAARERAALVDETRLWLTGLASSAEQGRHRAERRARSTARAARHRAGGAR